MADEKIWCLKKELLFQDGSFSGYIDYTLCNFFYEIVYSRQYELRSFLEQNNRYKHFIIYIVILNEKQDQVFGYIRQGSEKRLTGQWSIGIGGHVAASDLDLRSAAIRESDEELDMKIDRSLINLEGFVNIESNPVNRVHFGIVFKYISDGNVKLKGSENKSGMWLSADDLESMQFEDWSEIIKPVVIGWMQE